MKAISFFLTVCLCIMCELIWFSFYRPYLNRYEFSWWIWVEKTPLIWCYCCKGVSQNQVVRWFKRTVVRALWDACIFFNKDSSYRDQNPNSIAIYSDIQLDAAFDWWKIDFVKSIKIQDTIPFIESIRIIIVCSSAAWGCFEWKMKMKNPFYLITFCRASSNCEFKCECERSKTLFNINIKVRSHWLDPSTFEMDASRAKN